ncbi:hypothetical protein NIE88_18280 [Sporolactobacillus shoreicorticis]|uniref:Uncharacterized protein n=1 Tax=Sporolactobacillus shoreicorticis TaxID=1923877 RepID=A0ABW5S3B6_9BACL|nr:hypothetical protein [Sporolactobacillus shoreicorticis]MCO7127695.1 hypothetical protein [Sporolactobacillus shoreicorticis]
MKPLIWTAIAVFILLLFILPALYLIHSWAPDKLTHSVDLSGESIGGYTVHDSINDASFRRLYGNPHGKEDNELYDYYHWKKRMETASIPSGHDQGSIVRFIVEGTTGSGGAYLNEFNNQLKTSKGIRLGDTEKTVLSKYGNDYYTYFDDGLDEKLIGYVDHKRGLKLEFALTYDSCRVNRIYFEEEKIE